MIGIIGGIGPAAGLNLARLIMEQVKVQKDQDHVPWILMNQPGKIVDRTEFLLGKVDVNPGDEIARQILLLEQSGCTVAGIACNTAHAPAIFDRIMEILGKAGSSIKLIHAIGETVRHASRELENGSRIGILGTTGSYQFKIHGIPLRKAGLEVIDQGMEIQEELIHQAIYHPEWGIKAQDNPPKKECLDHLQKAVDFYRGQGASALVLGCSEISLVIDRIDTEGLLQIRPMTVLAGALVDAIRPKSQL